MKAIVCDRYGPPDILRLEDVPTPTPGDDDVLIEVHSASVNAYDWRLLTADPFLVRLVGGGLLKPVNKILGADVAGRIEAVGENVTQFRPGDEVVADVASSGSGSTNAGTFAEYVCARAHVVARKPEAVSFDDAASLPMASVTALQGLRDVAGIEPSDTVLINGASGGVGTFAVQVAKSFGAEVTAVCSTQKLELTRSLGADRVIDYTVDDFTRERERYDVILAVNGYHPLHHYVRALKRGGAYVMAGGTGAQMFQTLLVGPFFSLSRRARVKHVMARPNADDLGYVLKLVESGRMIPVIDRRYPLKDVPDALRYVRKGHAGGKVVIQVKSAV